MVCVHPDGGLCVTDGLFGHVDTPVVCYVHPDGGVSVTDGLFGHIDTPVCDLLMSSRRTCISFNCFVIEATSSRAAKHVNRLIALRSKQ